MTDHDLKAKRAKRVEGLAIPPETSDDRILRRALSIPMPRNARVDVHLYAHMTPAELHRAAQERVALYSKPPPDPELAGTWALLRDAWEWAAERNRL